MESESLSTSGTTYTTTRGYDQADRLTTITYPDASVVTQTFTARSQLQQVLLDSVSVATFTYDLGGRETLRTLGNGKSAARGYRLDNR